MTGVVTKVGDLAGEVDAVDENITVGNLLCSTSAQVIEVQRVIRLPTERAAGGRLLHIPLENVVLRDARLAEGGDGSGAASAESANDDDPRHPSGLLGALLDSGLDVCNQRILIRVA